MTKEMLEKSEKLFKEALDKGLSIFNDEELKLLFKFKDRVVNPKPTNDELIEFDLKLKNLNNDDDTESTEAIDTDFFLDIKNKYYTLYDYIINGYETFTGVRYPNVLDISLLIDTDIKNFLDLGKHIFDLDKNRHSFESIYLEVNNYISNISDLKIQSLDEISYKDKENIFYFLKDKNIDINQNTFSSAVNMHIRGEFSFENYKINAESN